MRLGVLASGSGSNLQAILDGCASGKIPAQVAVVVCNVPGARALERARAAGAPTVLLEHNQFASRDEYDRELVAVLRRHGVELVCLAGFMRLLGPALLSAFQNKILNIHPSLLPAFPGLEAQRQALEHGVKTSGCTVHFVDETLDGGPIIEQRAVPVCDTDTVESLSARILIEEHKLYPEAVSAVLRQVAIKA